MAIFKQNKSNSLKLNRQDNHYTGKQPPVATVEGSNTNHTTNREDPLHRQKLESACRQFFQDADRDGGGSISPLEFSKHLKETGKHFQQHEGPLRGKSWFDSPFSIYQQIDDDSSGEIDESEFVEFVMNNKDDSNAMFRQLLMDADTPDIPPPLPPASAPPAGRIELPQPTVRQV